MIDPVQAGPPVQSAAVETARDRLMETTRQLEGVFMNYLTQALRSTVPNGGTADAPGSDIYASMLDEHLAHALADHTRTGIAEALYRQLTGEEPLPPAEGSPE